ncbi:hypothetical protein [Candidatus Palauibacter sp.]|uniref:hypothetical protein n=1 Tax=Candidatus Palauibacter sp. TaxID=3101350 RepID=UPI003B59300F
MSIRTVHGRVVAVAGLPAAAEEPLLHDTAVYAIVTACIAAGHVPIGLILLALQFCTFVVPYPWRGPSSRAGMQAPANRDRRR